MKKTSIGQLKRILAKIKKYKSQMQALSDEELSKLTEKFRTRLATGESLDHILPEAYAAVCEADYRVLGKFPYDVQIMGGIALHKGCLAEMNTGEGKTLVATMPLYLNALTGKSNILVTTNEYLALRDAEEMGQVYRFMGLTVAAGVKENADNQFTNDEKKLIYASDIVYTTHSTLGFDYLLNNLVTSAEDRFMRELYYCIIDEADSVLLDSAQTPLIISGFPRVQSNLYELANFFIKTLKKDEDYEVEEKQVWLTQEGIKRAERFFRIDNFYAKEHFEINRHVTLALRAHAIFEAEKEYVISKDGVLVLLDGGSGRMMPGVKLRGGQHQAIECKEGITVSQENRSVASITYQNLFLLFEKMSGMSGTIADAKTELTNVYGVQVIVIPPNCKVARIDHKDVFYKDAKLQFSDAISEALKTHQTGQPVLIVTSTIGETEFVSKILIKEQIPHNVLNANNAFWEAAIIKEAGQLNAVTVATSMAGRGTDIKLTDEVKALGGLAVIGIGRMENVRQERQARGRAGRQGDPGFSRFFVCLEDAVVAQHGSIKVEKYAKKKGKVSKGKLKALINGAQKRCEENAVASRKHAIDYDQVLQRQRKLIYDTRNELLDGGELQDEKFMEIARRNIQRFLEENRKLDEQQLNRYLLDNVSYRLEEENSKLNLKKRKLVEKFLLFRVRMSLQDKKHKIQSEDKMKDFMRIATLNAIDDAWVEQVDYLQQLQAAVTGRATAQRNPVFEYQKDGLESFQEMEKTIHRNIMRNVLLSEVYISAEGELSVLLP